MDAPEVPTTISPAIIKMRLRENLVGDGPIKVLDTYYKNGGLWPKLKKQLKRSNVEILRITEKKGDGVTLVGNNVKYVKSLDLSGFTVFDVDSPGSPYAVLSAILNNRTVKNAKVFFTLNRIMNGGLDSKMLYDLGFSKKMVKAVRPILKEKAFDLFKGWLGRYGIKSLKYYALKYDWGKCYCGFFEISR